MKSNVRSMLDAGPDGHNIPVGIPHYMLCCYTFRPHVDRCHQQCVIVAPRATFHWVARGQHPAWNGME